ncbi:unnamed protein product [Paramecium pentaurelia]|uniref:Ubiquitin-like domain-containing protein n=1 Tax=Paramecium pentaurelia TaxID=43138 RepID=A0A8S1XLH3_9CILI|nr:unnamed protein product [Paramecium pentaurelia]
MINVTFKIDQLKINLTQLVYLNQQIISEIRRILYKSGIDLSGWDSFQCQVTYNDVVLDSTKTFNEAGVIDCAILSIKLSLLITLEIVNKQFPSSEINVDAFDSIQQFKDLMIQNYLRNTQFDIIIINGLDGKLMEKDTWIQNGVGNSIPILLDIQIKQRILWKGELLDWNFNIFYPISKVIQNFKNKLNINGIVSLQCQNTHLKPELSYFDHNLPLNVNWSASVPNELIYRVQFQKQSKEKQIICSKDNQINNVIKQLRKDFNINRTNKIILMYQWALDQHATFAQEAIPNFSLLKLVEEEYKGEFQIFLKNINENALQTQSIQTQYVNNDTSLGELSRKIPHQNDQEVNFYFESQDQILGTKQRMEDLNIYYGATIMYKIIQKQNIEKNTLINTKIKAVEKLIEFKKFGLLIIDINIVINIDNLSIQNNLLALAEVVRFKLSLPKNQIIQFSLGTQLLSLDQQMYEIMNGKFEFLQAKLQTTIKISLQNKNTSKSFQVDINLEDTLRKISEKYQLEAKFLYNNIYLGLDETFSQLNILNGEIIIYELVSTPKEDVEIPIAVSSQSVSQNNELHQASPFNSNAISVENLNQQQLKSQQNSNQVQADQPINNLNDTLITIKAQAGEKVYKFQMKGSDNFEILKKAIFDLAVQGDEQNVKQYNLIYGEQVLRDEQIASTLNKQEIQIQFKLK